VARRNCYTGKYELTKEEYLSAKYYAQRYMEWLAKYNALKDSVAAIVPDDMPHGKGGTSAPTERLAIERDELAAKIKKIEDSAREADEQIGHFILVMAVTPGMTYDRMAAIHNIPCSKDMFYDRRRKFYWLLSKKI
jgi:hypothetical protein